MQDNRYYLNKMFNMSSIVLYNCL